MIKYWFVFIYLLILLSSCEHIIDVDLNSSAPAFVVDAKIFQDSVCTVRLTTTTSFFSLEKSGLIEDASIIITDGIFTEALNYIGNGYYKGKSVCGTEGRAYKIKINHGGQTFEGTSYMPHQADIISVHYSKSDSRSILNPNGETVFTISCDFSRGSDKNNFYMIRFISNGTLLERYYLLTDNKANSGIISTSNEIINFSESIFYDGGEIDVQLYSIDEPVYNYFLQMSDILFWKRRVEPPTPYNPKSNLSNGVLGYFAAWAYSSKKIVLQ
jgi:hypothetical protein